MIFQTGFSIVVMAIMLSACEKDNSQELIEKEKRLLEQYLADNNITLEPTASGLYHIPIVEGTGMSPKINTWVEIEYTGILIDGTVFATSDENVAAQYGIEIEGFLYGPSRFQLGQLNIKGLNEGIQLMKVGGISQFIIPSSIGLGEQSSSSIPAYSTLIYTVELLEAFDDPDKHEQEKIWAFLDENAFENVDSTESGLYYIQEKAGTGELFKDGDWVDVYYSGQFLDGREFDTNIGGNVFTFMIPGENIIQGWNEGIKLMRDGENGILIIPYDLGYGEEGSRNVYGFNVIPPYMTLVFYLTVNKAS
jgi:FKBP-type peptidyl-prolyl cis-trans isomerase